MMFAVAVAAVAGFAAASQAAVIYWAPDSDPYFNTGFTGKLNNDDFNFWFDGGFVQAAKATGANSALRGDDVIFGNPGVPTTVPVDTGAVVKSITLNGGGYNFTGTLTFGIGSANVQNGAIITNVGNNEIQTIAFNSNIGGTGYVGFDVTNTLKINSITTPAYAKYQKTGDGVLTVGSITGGATNGFEVLEGKFIISGTGNYTINNLIVGRDAPGGNTATFAGNSTITLLDNVSHIYGHIAPGYHDGNSNFSTTTPVGTFTITGNNGNTANPHNVNFYAFSSLDLDLRSPGFDLDYVATGTGEHDALVLNRNNQWGRTFLNIFDGATVNINDGVGSLEEGIYRIVTVTTGTSVTQVAGIRYYENVADFLASDTTGDAATGGGFQIGNAPAGYDYSFEYVYNAATRMTAIDLIVTLLGDGPVGIVDNTGEPFSFKATANVSSTSLDTCNGLTSTIATGDKTIGEVGEILGTTATILGENIESASIRWRTRLADEIFPTADPVRFPGGENGLISDVIQIAGTGDEIYVLEMSYDGEHERPYIVRLAGTDETDYQWINDVCVGEFFAMSFADYIASFDGETVFDPIVLEVGTWGVGDGMVWVVLDQGGIFAVVPEPASLGLLGLGAAAMLLRRKR